MRTRLFCRSCLCAVVCSCACAWHAYTRACAFGTSICSSCESCASWLCECVCTLAFIAALTMLSVRVYCFWVQTRGPVELCSMRPVSGAIDTGNWNTCQHIVQRLADRSVSSLKSFVWLWVTRIFFLWELLSLSTCRWHDGTMWYYWDTTLQHVFFNDSDRKLDILFIVIGFW